MAACREALTLDEGHAWAWFNLGKTQSKVGSASSLEESVASYVRALRLQPGWVPVWESLGSALEAGGRSAEARHSFGRAAELRGPGVRAAESGEGAEGAAEGYTGTSPGAGGVGTGAAGRGGQARRSSGDAEKSWAGSWTQSPVEPAPQV